MIDDLDGPVAYILKRYPRLSETFILSEICAMERLGCDLQVFSLLQPEPPPHHAMVADVRAGVTHLPAAWAAKIPAVARAHVRALAASPGGYLRAAGRDPRRTQQQSRRADREPDRARPAPPRGVARLHRHRPPPCQRVLGRPHPSDGGGPRGAIGDSRRAAGGRRPVCADVVIDPTTATVKLRAIFANSDEALFPNRFVNARLLVDTLRQATIVPVSAVQAGTLGNYVYVVEADHTVSARPVTLGPQDGDRVAVLAGVSPGAEVVVDGADRLHDGAKVAIPDAAAPAGPGAKPRKPRR